VLLSARGQKKRKREKKCKEEIFSATSKTFCFAFISLQLSTEQTPNLFYKNSLLNPQNSSTTSTISSFILLRKILLPQSSKHLAQ
jgi:hypothetical protein